ncbi:hypothetical protein BOX15_Mlig021392g1, partial [Macrostomum lignano]
DNPASINHSALTSGVDYCVGGNFDLPIMASPPPVHPVRSVTLLQPSQQQQQQSLQQFSLTDPDLDSPNWQYADSDGLPPQLLMSLYEKIASEGVAQLEWRRPSEQQPQPHPQSTQGPAFVGQTILIAAHQHQQQHQQQQQYFSVSK